MTQKTDDTMEQIDKALNEIDGVDADQKIFRVDNETYRFNDIEFKLIEDYREAFDIEMMENRFTDYLLKYDYIVGDIAYEKLRLRGFFDDHRKGVPIDMKISNLEDYLVEYCNFGCQYFVFERVDKKKEDPESYFKRPKRQNRGRKNSNRRNQQTNKPRNQQNQRSNKGKNNQKANNHHQQKEFEVVKKQEKQNKKSNTRNETNATSNKKETSKKKFKIRKKND